MHAQGKVVFLGLFSFKGMILFFFNLVWPSRIEASNLLFKLSLQPHSFGRYWV